MTRVEVVFPRDGTNRYMINTLTTKVVFTVYILIILITTGAISVTLYLGDEFRQT